MLIFLVIGGIIIATSYRLNLKEPDDRKTFLGKFSGWVVGVGKNVIKTVGYAFKLDWLPEKTQNESMNYTNFEING